MTKLFDRKRVNFYLWVGSVYLLVWLIVAVVHKPEVLLLQSVDEFWRALYIIFVMYLFFEYTLPQLSRKRIARSVVLVLFQLALFSFGLTGWRALGISLSLYTPFTTSESFYKIVGQQFGASMFALVFFGVIRHVNSYILLKRDAQQLKIEKQAAELNYLKSQTNPHFLFNTLNNIYSLTRDKSDLAPESVLRLSKILRFMLYETGGTFIALEQELKIIEDYVELETLRYDNSLNVGFNYDIEDMKQSIPPLLLIPLVENAFKHGISETRSSPLIDIHLTLRHRRLTFVVKNSTDGAFAEEERKERVGLSNLRRQLQLLYSDYDLSIQRGESMFTATLTINLASHV